MKRLYLLMLAAVFCWVSASFGTYDADYTVNAYKLTTAQEGQFNATDGQLSPFWATWEEKGFGSVVLAGTDDLGFGVAPQNETEGGCQVKVGYGDNGMYILYRIFDDDWQDPIPGWVRNYEIDGLEFIVDKHGAQELYNCASCFIDKSVDQLTKTFLQIQVRIGGSTPQTTIDYSYYEPTSGNCTGDYLNGRCWNRDEQMTTIETQYGVKVDNYWPDNDPNTRYQEWLVPWTSIGPPGNGLASAKLEGENLAFTYGYNDYDAGSDHMVAGGGPVDIPTPSAFRWRNQGDPFGSTMDTWGDILFTEPVEEADPIGVIHFLPAGASSVRPENIVKTEYFDVTGKKLRVVNNTVTAPKSGIILQKQYTETNQVLTNRVMTSGR